MRRAALVAALFLALAALLPVSPARADSWIPPHRTTYFSANRAFRLVVTPHVPADRNLRPYTQEATGPTAPDMARAILQRRDGRGGWRTQWQGPLRNAVMPVGAMIANDGRYVVTFNDWGGTGTGPNVVVIYDGTGGLVRALSLSDLVSEDYALTLGHSFSSIFWGGGRVFSADGDTLILGIMEPDEDGLTLGGDGGPLTLELTLATGQVIPPTGPAWEVARTASARVRATQRAWVARRLAFMTEPLLGPVNGDYDAWQSYLIEAFYRLYPGPVHPSAWSLEAPGAERYVRTRDFAKDILVRSRLPADGATLLGSPDEEDLIRFLAEALPQIRPGAWRGGSLYIAAHDPNWPRIVAIVAPTGATPIQIDPTEPIPQLPERLRTYIETGASGPLTPPESTQD